MKPFSIVHVFAPNVLAGAERVVITGLNSLIETHPGLHIILIKELRNPTHVENFISFLDKRINVSVLKSKSAIDLDLIKKMREEIQSISNPVIHTHGYKALILTFLAVKNSFPFVHTHHGNTSHTFKVKIYEWLAFKTMKKIDATICVSDAMKTLLEKSVPSNQLFVIENMLSLTNASEIRNERIKKYKTSPINKLHLLFVGRLSPEKGILYLINHFKNLEIANHFSLTVVGDGPEKEAIIEKIAKDKLEENITLVGFIKNPAKFYEQADILIMPSFTEGMPMTLIESLAVGMPVIANNVGAISTLLNKDNGILIEHNNITEWKNAFSLFKDNFLNYSQKTIDQSIDLENKFSAKRWASHTLSLYESIFLKK